MKEIGLNLYSVRNLIATEEDFLETALKLKEMGYTFFQYSGAPFESERIKRVTEATGTSICLTHMPMGRLLNETEKVMEENLYFGNRNIGLGMMPATSLIDEKSCKENVEKLNRVGELMQKNGCRFFWHHHSYEFLKHGGQTIFDYVVENAPYIHFTLDTYWLQVGGVNILEYIEKLKGRAACVHLKDLRTAYTLDANGYPAFAPEYAPCGDGVLNFKDIIAKMRETGVEHYLVEQDNAADLPDTLMQVERSSRYLKQFLKN